MAKPSYDALILGAGPAGATAALLLARAGWSVAIVEKSAFPRRKVCGEFLSATTLPVLQALGVADAYLARAGPAVRRAGLFETDTDISAPMPGAEGTQGAGRALGREHLDNLLLMSAIAAGATCFQPWRAVSLAPAGEAWRCRIEGPQGSRTLDARRIIAATGSWERAPLFDPSAIPHRDGDLLGFKAHFANSALPEDLMPLLVFPGGYGGMVHSDGGRVSISVCIRRSILRSLRANNPGRAGDAVLAHVRQSCRAVGHVLAEAERQGSILSAGPIRPGLRACYGNGIFAVGNRAGEAHPIIAEGIGMAMQSAWLLCRRLIGGSGTTDEIASIGAAYERDWRRHFAFRLRAAALFAQLALRPSLHGVPRLMLRSEPRLLTLGARMSGKAHRLEDCGPSIREAIASTPFTNQTGVH
jgi:flavin-dependent dehydrogenase